MKHWRKAFMSFSLLDVIISIVGQILPNTMLHQSAAMDIDTTIDYLANLPLYDEETPFFVYPSLATDYDPDDPKLSNVQFEKHKITVRSIRGREAELGLDKSGFQVLNHA